MSFRSAEERPFFSYECVNETVWARSVKMRAVLEALVNGVLCVTDCVICRVVALLLLILLLILLPY